ncbi:MAG TPA: hypothetical protein VF331_28020 [Polyangiales bacterium]
MNLDAEDHTVSGSLPPAAKKSEDTPPQGLAWGDGERGTPARRPAVRAASEELKGLFGGPVPTSAAGSVAAQMPPPPPAGDPLAQLFADQRVAAPAIVTEGPNEAELQRQHASEEGELLENHLQGNAPTLLARPPMTAPAPEARKRPSPAIAMPSRPQAPAPASPATQPARPAPMATLVGMPVAAAPEPQVHGGTRSVELDTTQQALELDPGQPVRKGTRPTPPTAAGKARAHNKAVDPPPPPATRKTTIAHWIVMVFAVLISGLALAWGGAWLGFYELAPEAWAMLGSEPGMNRVDHSTVPPAAATKPAANAANATPQPLAAQKAAQPASAAVAKAPATTSSTVAEPVAKSNAKPVPEPAESHAAKAPSTEAAVAKAAPTPAPASTPAPVAKSAAPAPAAADSSAEAGDGKLMAAARARLNAHDVGGAETLAREALAQDRDDHHAMEVLAQALIDQRRGTEALKYAEMIVKKRPKRAAYRVIQGDAKALLGDKAGAESAWAQALTLEPNNKSIQHRLGI